MLNTTLSAKRSRSWNFCRKRFSQRRRNFPSRGCAPHRGTEQGLGKLKSQQVVTIRVSYPENFRSQIARVLWDGCGGGERCARNFQRNLRRWPQSPMNRHQHTPGGNVQCSGELKEVFAILVVTPDKYRYCEGQTNPFTALHFRLAMVQNPTLPVTVS
jgi:hypothetical protein